MAVQFNRIIMLNAALRRRPLNPFGASDGLGVGSERLAFGKYFASQNLLDSAIVPLPIVPPIGNLKPFTQTLSVDNPIALLAAGQLVRGTMPPLGWVLRDTGPNHVHVNIEKTALQMDPAFDPGGVKTIRPK